MKQAIFVFVILILGLTEIKPQCGGGGELLIGFTSSTDLTFDLSITTNEYCWDKVGSEVVPVDNFSFTGSGTCIKFTRPGGTASNDIYWGIFNIAITVKDNGLAVASRSFTLNLKDEN